MAAGNLYSADNPVFASFCFYAAVIAVKMLLMSFLTAYHRLTKNVKKKIHLTLIQLQI